MDAGVGIGRGWRVKKCWVLSHSGEKCLGPPTSHHTEVSAEAPGRPLPKASDKETQEGRHRGWKGKYSTSVTGRGSESLMTNVLRD